MRIGALEKALGVRRDRLFSLASELEIDGVEMEPRGDLADLVGFSTAAGVPICSLICDGAGLGDAGPERQAARERLIATIEDAARLRIDGIMLPHFGFRDLTDPATIDRFVEDIGAAAQVAERACVTLGWENDLSAPDTLVVLARVDSTAFRCYFDLGNCAKRGGDPSEELRVLGGWVWRIHVKNVNKQPLDAQGVDLAACLQVLRDRGYDNWLVLETPVGSDPAASARHNRDVLTRTWSRFA